MPFLLASVLLLLPRRLAITGCTAVQDVVLQSYKITGCHSWMVLQTQYSFVDAASFPTVCGDLAEGLYACRLQSKLFFVASNA